MSIARKLQAHLKQHNVKYKLISHPHTGSSMETAEVAHIPGDALAKGVLVKSNDAYLMVVIPSDYYVELETLHKLLEREVEMATEAELSEQFPDCEVGAIPPLGHVYGIETIWDPTTTLGTQERVFFEAGDHQQLVRVSGEQFHELMAPAVRGEFSRHM